MAFSGVTCVDLCWRVLTCFLLHLDEIRRHSLRATTPQHNRSPCSHHSHTHSLALPVSRCPISSFRPLLQSRTLLSTCPTYEASAGRSSIASRCRTQGPKRKRRTRKTRLPLRVAWSPHSPACPSPVSIELAVHTSQLTLFSTTHPLHSFTYYHDAVRYHLLLPPVSATQYQSQLQRTLEQHAVECESC